MKRFFHFFLSAFPLFFCSTTALGQSGAAYDTLALRIESHWVNRHIMRGVDGPKVGTAGVFRTANVEQIVAGSPRAQTEAKLFRASHRSGSVGVAIGALTFVGGVVIATNNSNSAATPIFMIGGLGGIVWGARQLDNAYASLSRAVWWYNRDIR